jgi:hypothetical protein
MKWSDATLFLLLRDVEGFKGRKGPEQITDLASVDEQVEQTLRPSLSTESRQPHNQLSH